MQKRRKPKYVPGWFTEQQHAKLTAIAALKDSSMNGVLCDLVDAVGVELVMPNDLFNNAKNGAGTVLADAASAVLT